MGVRHLDERKVLTGGRQGAPPRPQAGGVNHATQADKLQKIATLRRVVHENSRDLCSPTAPEIDASTVPYREGTESIPSARARVGAWIRFGSWWDRAARSPRAAQLVG
jgi:hypothetical protein